MWLTRSEQADPVVELLSGLASRNVIEDGDHVPQFDRAQPLLMISDYSGANPESTVETFSFLLLQPACCSRVLDGLWLARLGLNDNRRIRYSRLGQDAIATRAAAVLADEW